MIDFCVTQFSQPRAVATLKFFYYNVALTFMINNNNDDVTSRQIARKIGIHPLSAVHIILDDLRLEMCEKKTCAGAVRNRSKLYQAFAIKLT